MSDNFFERIEKALNDIENVQALFKMRYDEECIADKEIKEVLKIAKAEHEEIQQYRSIGTPEQFASYKAMFDDEMYHDRMLEAIGRKMTDELSEYKAIGTVDEFKELKENSLSGIEFAKIYAAIETLKKYEAIGTVDECREAVEKQKPKKPIWKQVYEDMEDCKYFHCPTCGELSTDYIPGKEEDFYFHCLDCGQAFSWERDIE